MVSVAVLAMFCDANAAQNGRASMMPSVTSAGNTNAARMPTMPTFSLNTIGNPAVTTINQPAETNVPHNTVVPTPTPKPDINPDPKPDDKPDTKPDDKPKPECPDGGVKDSTYTISMCMNDLLQCINTGALQGGLNDLFNEEVRNAIMGGMKICQPQIDKCVTEVRVNCRNVYIESNDVWLDFNSRIIQPEYYNFVLRKTGLTPNQAENTCLLLDRNTYGASFAAVSDTNAVNNEYSNKVGAYNGANGGSLSKKNPQGVDVNTEGYDGNRGHYARWDASNAECLIRVAAYNKDKLITNSWLFGAVGDDRPAEVWEKAGSTFTCNKNLFDFSSLLNKTKTAAVVGVGGGTVVGASVGAAAGAAAYKRKSDFCENQSNRNKLANYIKNIKHTDRIIENYVGDIDFDYLDEDDCDAILDLYSQAQMYRHALDYCEARLTPEIRQKVIGEIEINGELICNLDDRRLTNKKSSWSNEITEQVTEYVNHCAFKALDRGLVMGGEASPLCDGTQDCIKSDVISKDLAQLESILKKMESEVGIKLNTTKGKQIGKGLGIGAATGAGVGGIITGITALVEKNNITCKVGDGLNTVSFGKAHTIDSLKDFYVKWNLRLPDAITPTSAVIDWASWEQACSQFNSKLMDCPNVQINLKDEKGKYTFIQSACKVSGNICIVNDAVATSHGIE